MSTEVLQLPGRADGPPYYHNPSLHSQPVRRSPSSSSSLLLDGSRCSSSPRSATPHADHLEWLPANPSPSASRPMVNTETATAPTASAQSKPADSRFAPRSQFTLDTDTELSLPDYDNGFNSNLNDVSSPPSPVPDEDLGDDATESTTTETTRSDSPLHTPTVVDDTAIKEHPSRQVDFLSHDWREEDIWSSWRHIVSQRKAYGEKSRLENASWRTWAKSKHHLPTISPEKLNWMKESDVTWLYGPLKLASSYPITYENSEPASQISKNNSFVTRKPCLKKRSVSEVMLQKSISTSSLVKQAAACVQAQDWSPTNKASQHCNFVDSSFPSESSSRARSDYCSSQSTSGGGTPHEYQERRHIRFDDRVEQCIAVDCKDQGLGEESEGEEEHTTGGGSDSGSDDGVVMMSTKRPALKKRRSSSRGSRSNSRNGMKTIETLPATTLKYRTDSPNVTEEAQHHTFGRSWSSDKLSPSASQETLRPSNPSSNFLLPEDDDDDVESDSSWSFGASNPRSSLGASAGVFKGLSGVSGSKSRSSTSDVEINGMRRTGSGMFMPIDEDEDDIVAAGLFGRVSETINTARDIAHVIWNVGWRK